MLFSQRPQIKKTLDLRQRHFQPIGKTLGGALMARFVAQIIFLIMGKIK